MFMVPVLAAAIAATPLAQVSSLPGAVAVQQLENRMRGMLQDVGHESTSTQSVSTSAFPAMQNVTMRANSSEHAPALARLPSAVCSTAFSCQRSSKGDLLGVAHYAAMHVVEHAVCSRVALKICKPKT